MTKTTEKDKSEWIAVPVPDSGISREWVDAAREAVRNNKKPSSAGRRYWELSGGIFSCGCCGSRMAAETAWASRASAAKKLIEGCHFEVWLVNWQSRAEEFQAAQSGI